MVIDNLQPDRDVRQIEHEIRCSIHFGQKGFKVVFADLEDLGRFDLLVETPSASVEVECKTVSEGTGSQIKADLTVGLSETFLKIVRKKRLVDQAGVFILTFKKPTDECKHAARQLEAALRSPSGPSFHGDDFDLAFSPRPIWQELLSSNQTLKLRQQIELDSDIVDHGHCVTMALGSVVGLSLKPHKPSELADRTVEVIKEGADKCTGQRPSLIWLQFSGFAEAEFRSLAQFSIDNRAGLNNLVGDCLHPSASTTDRSHVRLIRFSAGGGRLASNLGLAPNLVIVPTQSTTGTVYDVENPLCRFSQLVDC